MQHDDIHGLSEVSTPSPSASMSTTPATSASSMARKPPRKSTLTQQQRNQKRQRATQDQLLTLEIEFNRNPTPTAAARERIAQDINMTERSVQIWFQNRRAKLKLMARKTGDAGDDGGNMSESTRQMLAAQALDSGEPFPFTQLLQGRLGGPFGGSRGGGMVMGGEASGPGKVVIHHFTCRSLSIGNWRRVGQNAMDLVVFYSPEKACMTYYINNDSAGYKIEYPFASIKHISLESGEPNPGNHGGRARTGGLMVELSRPPSFFMDSSGSGGFYQCGDFTEDQQASRILVHHLGGNGKVMSGQLAKLVSLDSFQNRHGSLEMATMPASAPVSPTMGLARPASQPSGQFACPPPPQSNRYHDSFGANLRPGRHVGHKRQRSRSVPVAVDFSMLHSPVPTFHIQQPSNQFHLDPNIFHPLPQHPSQTYCGPDLRVDTNSNYGMDYRSMPMSATTASPSEYGRAPPHRAAMMPATDVNTPYSLPFLSPSPMVDPGQMLPPSHTPLSHISHPDPVIADQSPPFSAMPRSASADMFGMTNESGLPDDGLMLSEMYSKQNLNLAMPSPSVHDGSMMPMHDMSGFHPPGETIDMPMMPYGTIDPSSLKAENAG